MTDLDTAAAVTAIHKLRADYLLAHAAHPDPEWAYGDGYLDGYLSALDDVEDALRCAPPEST